MFYSNNFKKFNKIQHCFFSRKRGSSSGIYSSLNCGIGSKDAKGNVNKNLEIVSKKFQINRKQLVLMNQRHTNNVKVLKEDCGDIRIDADAVVTKNENLALGVLTADCAPVLLYESEEKIIGCIHAGWKGAINGIIENTIERVRELGGNPEKIFVCIGPCIDKSSYQVKEDFYSKFIKNSKKNEIYFFNGKNNSLYFDLRGFVTKKLNNCGVSQVDNINLNSFSASEEYFSHRRAKKLGENDYGRCISVIKKTKVEN